MSTEIDKAEKKERSSKIRKLVHHLKVLLIATETLHEGDQCIAAIDLLQTCERTVRDIADIVSHGTDRSLK